MNWHHSAVMRLAKCHATLMWRVTSLEDRADMTRISFMISLCTLSFLALGQPVVAAAEPSVRDVYALAESGRVQEAQQLMQQILELIPLREDSDQPVIPQEDSAEGPLDPADKIM